MPYLGIDGGGTKTEFIMIDKKGNKLYYLKEKSIDYKRIGRKKFTYIIKKSINRIVKETKIKLDDIEYTFLGIPCYGDELTKQEEKDIDMIVKKILGNNNYKLGNDVEAGWAGSLACKPGINLVAGTGAIGFGKDAKGNKTRASGWGHKIGDEGSAYWLGSRLLNAFTKQADERKKKTLIYSLVRQRLSLKNDFEIINLITDKNNFGRKEVANLALILYEAASNGDEEAVKIYRKAANELSRVVIAINNKLDFVEKEVTVTYSGGVFNAGDLILKPLKNILSEQNFVLEKPILKPVTGAALYALILDNNKKSTDKIVNKLKRKEGVVTIDG
ncbi:MAG: ATPase [Halanaerobiales bacterium]|nr:ATPase [Halanaerobiales bacterium]